MSATLLMNPSSVRLAASFSPKPSISIAPREAKCSTVRATRGGQRRFGQRALGPSVTTGVSQTGQRSGASNGRSSSSRPSRAARTGPTTSGITSPARCTITSSPISRPFACTCSALCSVATLTRAPPTTTGSRTANGVSAPVRPTETWMSRSRVTACSAGNLYAVAQRGSRPTTPSCRW